MDAQDRFDIPGFTDPRLIGEGGFGRVFVAQQTHLDRQVAVKILFTKVTDSAVRTRFDNECLAMGKLGSHPNILQVFDSGYQDGRPYLVMEFMAGGSMGDRLESGALPPERAAAVAVAMGGALETAHRGGVLHRDVKPENILLSEFGEPMLADFGIARLDGGPSTTTTGKVTTSVTHAAPEIFDAATPDATWDTYALGSTMFTFLTGRYAFYEDGLGFAAMVNRIFHKPVPDLRTEGVPHRLAEVVERSMAKNPTDRYGSALAMGRALQQVQRDLGWKVTPMLVPGEPVEADAPAFDTVTVRAQAFQAPPSFRTPYPLPPVQGPVAPVTPTPTHHLPYGSSPPLPTGRHGTQRPSGWGPGLIVSLVVVGLLLLTAGVIGTLLVRRDNAPGVADPPVVTAPDPGPAAVPDPGPPDAPVFSEQIPMGEDGSAPYTRYVTVTDDTGRITLDVPVEWVEVNGRPLDDNGITRPDIRASSDLAAFDTTWTAPGVIVTAFDLPGATPEQILEGRFDTFNRQCTDGGRQDYTDRFYTGVSDVYTACGGTEAAYVIIAAQLPDGTGPIIRVEVQVVAERDVEALEAIVDSFIVR